MPGEIWNRLRDVFVQVGAGLSSTGCPHARVPGHCLECKDAEIAVLQREAAIQRQHAYDVGFLAGVEAASAAAPETLACSVKAAQQRLEENEE